MTKKPLEANAVNSADVEELLRLCQGWMAYLLTRLHESCIRVEASELRSALATLSCRVEREDSAYVIRLGHLEDKENETDDRGRAN